MTGNKARWVFPVAMLLSPIAAAAAFVWLKNPEAVYPRPQPSPVIGRQGEWVTRPDGRKVCRLAYDLAKKQVLHRGFCVDWQEPEPTTGQTVDGWVRSSLGYYQIMINGEWRP